MLHWAAIGCAPDVGIQLPDTELRYDGAQVRLHVADSRPVCDGTGPSMESMLSFLGAETELGDLEEPVDVYLVSQEQASEACGLGDWVFACSFVTEPNPIVVSSYLPTEHELVHSYLSLKQEVPRRRYAFLEEGFANVYGRDGDIDEPASALTEGLSFARDLPLDHYARAAHFMDFVLDEFGPAATTRMLLASTEARNEDDLDATFTEHLGLSTTSLVELYEQESISCTSAGWQRGYNCEDPAQEWHFSGTLRLDIGHACGVPTVLGESDAFMFERFTVDFPDSTTISIRMDTPAEQPPIVRLDRCGSCADELSIDHDLSRGPLFGLRLDPGTYVLTTIYPSGQPEPGVLKLRRE